MEALGAEKTKLESLLAALGGLPRQISPKKGSKMGPQKFVSTVLFEVPGWGPKLDPHFMASQKVFRAFQSIFNGFPRALLAAEMRHK